MKKTLLLAAAMAMPSTMANLYQNAVTTLANAPQEVKEVMSNAPGTYDYSSQFTRSSSVSYDGQIFRNVLMEDIKGVMNAQNRGQYNGTVSEAKNVLLSLYKYDEFTDLTGAGVIDGFSEFKVPATFTDGSTAFITEGFFYSDIQSPGKDLYSKMAGVGNSLRRGKLYGVKGFNTPDDLLISWFDAFAKNAVEGKAFTVPNGNLEPQTLTGAYVEPNGLDYAQLTQKFLYGAVAYSQAARDYLSTDLGPNKGLNADNTEPGKPGASYTAMEHHFDEGYGYFGAARDFLAYTDLEARTKTSIDTDGSCDISMKTEKNLGMSINSSRIDLTAADQNMDLSNQIMTAFLQGRELITKKPAGYKTYVEAQAQVILTGWEKTLAGVTIHYINTTIKEYKEYGTQTYLFSDFAKFWGEMKGYALSFQFNPKALMNDATFDEIHELMGDAPVLPHASQSEVKAYITKLETARELMRKTYDFTVNNTLNW